MGTLYDGYEEMSEEEIEAMKEQERHEDEIYNLSDEQIEQLMEYHGE